MEVLETVTVVTAPYTVPPPVRDGSLTPTVATDGSRTYQLSLGLVTDTATASATCDYEPVTSHRVGLGFTSDPSESWLGPTLAETYSRP